MAARWGTFLSQAVAGVESRLDNILAESDDSHSNSNSNSNKTASFQPATASRASSSTRSNDRLQARLAKAVGSKNAPGSPRNSSDVASRASVERPLADAETSATTTEGEKVAAAATEGEKAAGDVLGEDKVDAEPAFEEAGDIAQANGELRESSTSRTSQEADHVQSSREIEDIKAQHQKEVQEYMERIDSLQSKLLYMSKNAADAAKKAASSAPPGSEERKVAELEQRIALLMEEGQKLAGAEQQYRATIKKLRLQVSDNEKQLANLKQDKNKAMADAEALRHRLDSNEEKEKRAETLKVTSALQKEIDALKKDKANKDDVIRRREQEMKTSLEQAAAASADVLKKTLATEREKQNELENKNAALTAECEALREKTRLDGVEWGEKLGRTIERGRRVEDELRVELRTLESKLEGMRITAEEAASGSGGEAQVKLLRQIETLQSQYAAAKGNWQGIEASLLARAAGLEKEKDEAHRRESDMRKRARDAAGHCRTLEDELQDVQSALDSSRQELQGLRDQLAALRTSLNSTETALEQARAELEEEKRSASREMNVEERKSHSRPISPLVSVLPRNLSVDMVGFPAPARTRRIPTPGSIHNNSTDGLPAEQRRSLPHPALLLSQQPQRMTTFESLAETPVAMSPPLLRETDTDAVPSAPASPTHAAHDILSVSTVAAGPSVQLVERMSAAIRRLEAEKVTAKEEMTRVCAQRDEARGDIVSLMKELEEVKVSASRVPQLESQVVELDARYQTTLELLGEKSELVDELRADVEDVKAMYRELVERAVK